MTPKKTRDALEILRRDVGGDAEYRAMVEDERLNAWIARTLYEMRASAGLTQGELAGRVKTKQSVISRLEDADYEGHSLAMLRRVAAALGRRVEVRFVLDERAGAARRKARTAGGRPSR